MLGGPLSALTEEPEIDQVIKKLLEANLEFFLNSPNPRGCLIMTSAIHFTPEHAELVNFVRSYRDDYKERLVKRFELALLEKQIRPDSSPHDLAEYCLMVIHGMALRARDGVTLTQLVNVVEIALSGLKGHLTVDQPLGRRVKYQKPLYFL